MIRVAMVSFWHVHASDYARQALAHPEVDIVAVWDEEPERGRSQATALNVRYYERLEDLLVQPDIDGVIIDTPTSMHKAVMIAAAQAGKHIFTEKVISTTQQDCTAILAAIEQAGVKLMVSLPRLYHGYTQAIQDCLRRQLLGEITLVRARVAHDGATANWLPAHFFNLEQCGGGAMIDLGCHSMYLTRLFLGDMPLSVSATYSYITGREVEDNAVATLAYANGAIGVVEAGFVQRFSPFTLEVHGTLGSLLYGTPTPTLLMRSTQPGSPDTERWQELPLPPDGPTAFEQWIEHIKQDTIASENIQLARDLTTLMEAANLSARTRQGVVLETLS